MDASGTADTPVFVHVFDTRTEIVIQFRGAATAVAGNGEAKALRNHTGSIWTAEDTTSNGKILQMGVHSQYPVGDTNGWIVGKFESADLQFP
jgi:hypothetical protein